MSIVLLPSLLLSHLQIDEIHHNLYSNSDIDAEYLDFISKVFPRKKDFIYYRSLQRKINQKYSLDNRDSQIILDNLIDQQLLIKIDEKLRINIFLNQTRKQIFDLIEKFPGIYINAIKDILHLGSHQVLYHLGVLQEFNKIKFLNLKRIKAFALPEISDNTIRIGVILLKDSLRIILINILNQKKNHTLQEIANILSISSSKLHYNLNKLVEMQIISIELSGTKKTYIIHPEKKKLLETVLRNFAKLDFLS